MRLAALVLVLAAATAHADNQTNARALQQQGIELYRAKKYEDAIAALAKSYELEAQLDTLYALAQAERLGGHCPDAVVHYNQILEQTPDTTLAAAVQNNIGLCVTGKAKPPDVGGSSGPAPTPQGTTEDRRPSLLPVALLAGGGLFIGAAVGMFVAAGHSQDAASTAVTYDEYDRLTSRAGLERGLGYGFAITAAAGIGAAVYLILRTPDESSTRVSASVSGGATTVFVQARW